MMVLAAASVAMTTASSSTPLLRPASDGTATRPAIVEILLRNGRSLKVPVDVELKLLGQLVACVEAA